jgi:hypothetical protein
LTEISGFACRGCLVEVFKAAPDPTGFGEGKTYMGEARADVAGNWSVDISAISGIEVCDEITATATKEGEGTSEFAENALVNCMRMSGAPMAAVSPFPFLFVMVLVLVARAVWPEAPGWMLPAGAVLGLVFSGLLILVLVWIPNVQVDLSRRPDPPPDPLPGCDEFLDPKSLSPANGATFELEDDPLLSWDTGQDLPAGDVQWELELRAPYQTLYSQTTSGNSLAFSSFGIDQRPGGRYDWRLYGLLPSGEGDAFEPFCDPEAIQYFQFVNPLIAEIAQVEVEAEEPPAEGEPEVPAEETSCTSSVTATGNATCRYGPLKDFHELGYLLQGETAEALAQTSGAGWFRILLPNQVTCWVWSGAVETDCTDDLPIDEGPPPPSPTLVPPDTTPPPAPNTLAPKNGEDVGCVGSVNLSWSSVSDPSGISSYDVEAQRSTDNATWGAAPGSPWTTGGTSQSLSVECGWYYRWKVRAEDGAGNTGPYSGWSSFTVPLQ